MSEEGKDIQKNEDIVNKIANDISEKFEKTSKSLENKVELSAFEKAKQKIEEEFNEKLAKVEKALKIQGEHLAKNNEGKEETFDQSMVTVAKGLVSELQGKSGMVKKDISYANLVNRNLSSYEMSFEKYNPITPSIEGIFPHVKIGDNMGDFITYDDVTSWDPNAAWVDPCEQGTESTFTMEKKQKSIKNLMSWVKICKPALKDYKVLEDQIRDLLFDAERRLVAANLILGDGSAKQLEGLAYLKQDAAVPVVGESYYQKFVSPGISELVHSVKGTVRKLTQSRIKHNYLVVSQETADCLYTERDANGNSVNLKYLSADGLTVTGLKVIVSDFVEDDTAYMVDTSKVKLFDRKTASIEVGEVNNDFLENKAVAKITRRLALVMMDMDQHAVTFIPSIQAHLDAITKP